MGRSIHTEPGPFTQNRVHSHRTSSFWASSEELINIHTVTCLSLDLDRLQNPEQPACCCLTLTSDWPGPQNRSYGNWRSLIFLDLSDALTEPNRTKESSEWLVHLFRDPKTLNLQRSASSRISSSGSFRTGPVRRSAAGELSAGSNREAGTSMQPQDNLTGTWCGFNRTIRTDLLFGPDGLMLQVLVDGRKQLSYWTMAVLFPFYIFSSELSI